MIIRTLFICLICFTIHPAIAQEERYFAKNIIAGSSFTWLGDVNEDPTVDLKLHEGSWNINAAMSLSRRFYLGLQYLYIYTNNPDIQKQNFNMFGMFVQFNMLKRTDHRLFIESSINLGNYYKARELTASPGKYYTYLGIGLGYDMPLQRILPGLYLDLSVLSYNPLNVDVMNAFAIGQYIVGLNYRFGKTPKSGD